MEDSKKVFFTGTLVIVVVAVVVVVYYFFIRENPEEILPIQEVVQEEPVQVPEEEPVVEEKVPEPVHVELDKSDEFVRDLAKGLSSHKRYVVWLKRKDFHSMHSWSFHPQWNPDRPTGDRPETGAIFDRACSRHR